MAERVTSSSAVGIPNVVYDSNSAYRWDQLSESEFLSDVLSRLIRALGPAASEFSIHVHSTHDPRSLPALAHERSPHKRVLVRISDESGSVPNHLDGLYDHVFATYLPHDPPARVRIHPFPLGHVNDVPDQGEKEIVSRQVKIFFAGNLNSARRDLYRVLHPILRSVHPAVAGRLIALMRLGMPRLIRWDLSDHLRGEVILFTHRFRGGLPPDEYASLLADSRIVLCPAGFNQPETFRHYEALRAGAVVVTESLPDTILYREAPFLIATDWVKGLSEARLLADDLDRLSEMQAASRRHFEQVLSPEATAERMAGIMLSH